MFIYRQRGRKSSRHSYNRAGILFFLNSLKLKNLTFRSHEQLQTIMILYKQSNFLLSLFDCTKLSVFLFICSRKIPTKSGSVLFLLSCLNLCDRRASTGSRSLMFAGEVIFIFRVCRTQAANLRASDVNCWLVLHESRTFCVRLQRRQTALPVCLSERLNG